MREEKNRDKVRVLSPNIRMKFKLNMTDKLKYLGELNMTDKDLLVNSPFFGGQHG